MFTVCHSCRYQKLQVLLVSLLVFALLGFPRNFFNCLYFVALSVVTLCYYPGTLLIQWQGIGISSLSILSYAYVMARHWDSLQSSLLYIIAYILQCIYYYIGIFLHWNNLYNSLLSYDQIPFFSFFLFFDGRESLSCDFQRCSQSCPSPLCETKRLADKAFVVSLEIWPLLQRREMLWAYFQMSNFHLCIFQNDYFLSSPFWKQD